MKERIKKIIIVLLIMAGIVLVGALMHEFLPIWARCTVWGIGLIWLLYDVSKPEKKKTETYWYYIFKGGDKSGFGVQYSTKTEFDFIAYYKEYKDLTILNVYEISETQYKELLEYVNKRKEEQNCD